MVSYMSDYPIQKLKFFPIGKGYSFRMCLVVLAAAFGLLGLTFF